MILCCGEALIDMISTPTTGGRDGFVPHSGGAIFNTAIALGRLGARVGMLTGLSSDLFGQQLNAALQASHVDVSLIVRNDRPSTLAFVQLQDGHATYHFFDENSAGRMLAPEDMPQLPDDVSALYFGGISLASEPGAEAYAALIEGQGAGRAVMLDPNIRPGFIEDIDRYRARLDRMIARAHIVKVSDEDLNWIYPGPEALMDKVARLRDSGPSVVILTRGGEGAMAHLADGSSVSSAAKRVQVVDTVGAGDSFNAGFMANLSETGFLTPDALASVAAEAVQEALQFGASVAAVTVSRAGANPPWRHELG